MNATKTRTLLPLAVLSLVLLFGVIGCSRTGTVTGKVSYNGTPLTAGTVTFISEKATVEAQIDAEGEYKAERIPPGSAKVTVSTKAAEELKKAMGKGGSVGPSVLPSAKDKQSSSPQNIESKMKDKGTPEMPGADELKAKQEELKKQLENLVPVPDKYWDAKTSGLTYDITTGKQTININLEKVTEEKTQKPKPKK